MKIIEDDIKNICINDPLAIALGTFDGIHRGHRKIIELAKDIAQSKGFKSAVLTFDMHPLNLLKPEKDIKIITDNKVKSKIIEDLGIDYLIFVRFNNEFAEISDIEYINILKSRFNARAVVCGYNYTFGKFGKGNPALLKAYENINGYELEIVDKVTYCNHSISSSIIRQKIHTGDIKLANQLLGYNYFFTGEVIKCKQLGNKLGFPTANIKIDKDLCIKNGVYITATYVDGAKYPSITNVGYNPTINDSERMLETHLINFNGDLYGKYIRVEMLDFIRGEVKFNSIEELKNRVLQDIDTAKRYFSNYVYNI